MLQRANQCTAVEVLVAGKREDHKRPHSEKPRDQRKGLLRMPNLMKTPQELKDRAKYYRFHPNYGHYTKEYHDLKN
ncbi:hypothetical protein BHE74_00042970 [Ensete ventricosum]|nr:hypothetical protein BHE74_00042970 [Ensete ventricosum]